MGFEELDKAVLPMQKLGIILELSVLLSSGVTPEPGEVDTALSSPRYLLKEKYEGQSSQSCSA